MVGLDQWRRDVYTAVRREFYGWSDLPSDQRLPCELGRRFLRPLKGAQSL
jgi:hypothetical protein